MGSAFVGFVGFVVREGFEDRRKDGIDREGAEDAKGRGRFGFSEGGFSVGRCGLRVEADLGFGLDGRRS